MRVSDPPSLKPFRDAVAGMVSDPEGLDTSASSRMELVADLCRCRTPGLVSDGNDDRGARKYKSCVNYATRDARISATFAGGVLRVSGVR